MNINCTLSLTLKMGKTEVIEVPVSYEVQPRITTYPRAIPMPPAESHNFFCRLAIKSNEKQNIEVERVEAVGLKGVVFECRKNDINEDFVVIKGSPVREPEPHGQYGIRVFIKGEKTPLFVPIE